MSDIGFPGLDRFLFGIYLLLIIVPPALVGLILLWIGRWKKGLSGMFVLGLYVGLSMAGVLGLLFGWYLFFYPDPMNPLIAVVYAFGSTLTWLAIWKAGMMIWVRLRPNR